MAVTSIWRVKGWLGKVVIYVENPEKTTNPEYYQSDAITDRQYQGLEDVISYAVNSNKTQQSTEDADIMERYVSGVNCHPSTAREEMLAVKKHFGKEDGTIAYHGYQSFAPGEATPQLAHRIGVELAQRLWGERYQVVVATHLDKSNHNDVQKLVTSLFKATTPKGSQSNDPFWDTAASMLLSAIIFYLLYEAPEEEQNFPMVMEMLRAGEVREDDDTYQSPLDELFERLEMRDPNHIAVKYYKDYHSGSAKTLKSIQITLAARLEKFNLASVAALTATDELELASLGEKKVALFALIPDHDVSFNFLVSMVYSCTFEQLFRLADDKYKGALPVPVHFLMDEFANVSLPDDFDKLLATMRSRNVFVSIIQNIAQLKNLFEKQWESILGNCDEFLYLGGNETGTHKMIAESYLGKETIDMNTYGKSSGRSGNYSTNWQITGRELLDAAEVRMLDNRYALLFIRGEMPVMDEKYDLLNHPNVKYTPEKGGAPAKGQYLRPSQWEDLTCEVFI